MKTRKILLAMLAIGLSRCFIQADELNNNSTNLIKKIGDYSMMRGTNGQYIFVNPTEFWNGVWKENTIGWRVQLRIYMETNFWVPKERVIYPVSTNMMLRVECGSAVKNSWGSIEKPSGDKYFMTPNGKFAKFELSDADGNVISPNSNAGTNLLIRLLEGESLGGGFGQKLAYGTNLPAWVSPTSGSLMSIFPKTIYTNVYPQFKYGGIAGEIESATNQPPIYVGLLKLDEVYSITNEGDYTLIVQPVLYKRNNHANDAILDRVDLPSVTTKVHLLPNK